MNNLAAMYDQQYAYFNEIRPELPSDASRTLFIGDLSYFCSEEDLCTLFAPYGRILTVRVRRGVTGESLMHGFIALDTAEAAQRAIVDLDGVEFMGRNMRVQLSSDGQRPNIMAKENFVQVHVSFISKQTNMVITEKVLRDIFAPFGAIADVAIKKHTTIQKQHRQSGYGFVYFVEADSAYRAMSALKHNTVRDITLDCSISHKSEHLIRTNHRPSSSQGGGGWEQEQYANPAIGKKSLSFFEGSTSSSSGQFNNNHSNHSFFRTHSAESILRDRYGNMLSPSHAAMGNNISPNGMMHHQNYNRSMGGSHSNNLSRTSSNNSMPSNGGMQQMHSPLEFQMGMPSDLPPPGYRNNNSNNNMMPQYPGSELDMDMSRLSLGQAQSLRSVDSGSSYLTGFYSNGSESQMQRPSNDSMGQSPMITPRNTSKIYSGNASNNSSSNNFGVNTSAHHNLSNNSMNPEVDEIGIRMLPQQGGHQGGAHPGHHRTMQQTSSFNNNFSDRVARNINRPDSDYSIGSTSSNGSSGHGQQQKQLYSNGSGSNMLSPASQQGSASYPSSSSTPNKRGLMQQSQFDSFYGEPIMSLSSSSSYYLHELDSLLSISNNPSTSFNLQNGATSANQNHFNPSMHPHSISKNNLSNSIHNKSNPNMMLNSNANNNSSNNQIPKAPQAPSELDHLFLPGASSTTLATISSESDSEVNSNTLLDVSNIIGI